MELRRLGKTELKVSAIGLGGIPLQRVDEETALDIIREAHKEGINFIDTARGYTVSESLIGSALQEIGRDKFILATKSTARDYGGIMEELKISLSNLKTDYIDLFQFHNVSSDEDLETILGPNGALEAVKEMQEKGVIKHIGITSHSVDTLEKAIETDEFSTIQFPYNPVEDQGEKAFERANEKDMGVIAMKPIGGGAIAEGTYSLRYILENECLTSAIPGMDTVEQVKKNAEIGQNMRPLTEEESKILGKELETLGDKFCRRCEYCEPCTVGMSIYSQFLMEGYYTRYGLKDWALERYASMDKNAGDCIQCGKCEERCPYDLPIMEMLENVDNILGR